MSDLLAALIGLMVAAPFVIGWRRERSARRRAEYLATHDDLTGLPNRRRVRDHLTALLKSGKPTGVIMLDLDDFKNVNDTYDHDTGNDLLTKVGQRLQTLSSSRVYVGRLHGDEFVLIVDGPEERTSDLAQDVTQLLGGRPFELDGGRPALRVLGSVGYAQSARGLEPLVLLGLADQALSQAKQMPPGSVAGAHSAAGNVGSADRRRPRDLRRDSPRTKS
jgi:diguanylate cyclase (GGDEF)-like protein